MRLRLMTAVLGCVCAITSETGYGDEPPACAAKDHGRVTLCEGNATLYRGYKGSTIARGTTVQSGDRVILGPDARVAMMFENGPVVALGTEAELAIDCLADRWNFLLTSGEARVVHDGNSTLRLMSDQTILTVNRAIAHMDAQPGHTVMEVTNGSAVCEANEGRSWPINAAGAVNVDASGRVQPVGKVAWKLDGQQIRLVTAIQTSPALTQPSTAPPTVVPSAPNANSAANGESPVPLVNSMTDPTSDVTEPAPLVDQFQPLEDEDRDEEPRIAEESLPNETRSAFEDAFASDSSFSSTIGTFSGSSSLSLGSFSGGTGVFASGGVPGDANQQTFQGMDTTNGNQPFPGAIHLVTGFTPNKFAGVQLSSTEADSLFPSGSTGRYFSIGEGTAPSGQVVTGFLTGTSGTPNVIAIPKVGAYLVELDQYGIPDPGQTPLTTPPTAQPAVTGFTGLTGTNPTSPFVINATPIAEDRSTNQLNPTATFALGEFLVRQDNGAFTIDIRRSDQDRLIVKDVNGNDANDVVTPNGDVTFGDVIDPRFLPQSPTVKAPTGVAATGTSFRSLNDVRRGAFTTLMADQLKEYAGRTGQTRFVVDGKIVDISGYK